MNCWPSSFFTCGCLVGIDEHHAVLVEQALVALAPGSSRSPRFLNDEPRAAIGQHVGVHRRRGVERRTHAGTGVAIPRPLFRVEIDARVLPVAQLGRVRAALVAARRERRLRRLRSCANAARMSLPPAILAGSLFGPISTKSLYMTGKRFTPEPFGDEFLLRRRSWTNATSASPRRAMSSAWPVPSATTRTLIPVSFSNNGNRCPNRPDCSVDVVEATTMNLSCAPARKAERRKARAGQGEQRLRRFTCVLLREKSPLRLNAASEKLPRPACARRRGPRAGTRRRRPGASPARGCAWS